MSDLTLTLAAPEVGVTITSGPAVTVTTTSVLVDQVPELQLVLQLSPVEVLVQPPVVLEHVLAGPQGPGGPTGTTGAQGPVGPAGASGVVGAAEFNFAIASDTWTAVHNLNFTPSVMIYNSLGVQIGGLVTENTPTRTVVSFYLSVAGRLSLS